MTVFNDDTAAGRILRKWWEELQEAPGERAELRRAADLPAVVLTAAYQRLRWALLQRDISFNHEALACVAGLSARVKEPGREAIARAMGRWPPGKGGPRVSELRFKRLLATRDRREWYPLMRRVLALLDDTADLMTLAEAAWWWNDHTRRDWADAYYPAFLDQ
jgi:CRISPR system Cascade subunit CasB